MTLLARIGARAKARSNVAGFGNSIAEPVSRGPVMRLI